MAKSRPVIDRNTIDRFLKEGRGQGTLQDYKPWLTVRDVPSVGKSTRDKGWKTGRTHHFLSILELLYYLILEWSLMVTDIREQYPLLPIDDTLAIAENLGIKHPVHPKTKEPIVMTTDFYISLRNESGNFERARTIKYAVDLSDRRTLEMFEIERRYWEVRGIDWGIVTEHEIPTELAKNVDFLHDSWHLPKYMPEKDITSIAELLTHLLVERHEPLNELTAISDTQLGLKGGSSLKVAYYLLATRQWHIDMNIPIERVLWIEQAGSRVITIDIHDKKAWPEVHDRELLEACIASGEICLLSVDVYQYLRQPDTAFKPERIKRRDEAYEIIRDIVEKHEGELFFSPVLGPLVDTVVKAVKEKWLFCEEEERPKVKGRSKTTVYQYLRLYWQRGQMPNALLPAYDRCGAKSMPRTLHGPKRGRPSKTALQTGVPTGVNITDEIKETFRQGTKLFYDTPKKRGKEEAFERIQARFFYKRKDPDPDGIPIPIMPSVDEMPTFRQYQYWYDKEWDTNRSLIAREGISAYNLRSRSAIGSLRLRVPGPGYLYEIDATVADVYLVSRFHRRRIIGRPVIYVVIDVFSNLIVGISVSFEGPSWIGAMLALENMALDKVSFCKENGFDIEEHEWPSCGLPREILADRGELLSKNSDDLTNSLDIRMSTTAPYRPDWKGCVERHFGLLNEMYCSWVPGKVDDYPRRDRLEYPYDAKMTLLDFRKFIIDCVIEHNTTYRVPEDHLDRAMIEAGIDPYPCNLWEWGINNRLDSRHNVTRDELRLALLPKDEASVTREGIRFQNTRYTCELAERENWFGKVRSGERESWHEPIIYDPRALDYIYLRRENGQHLEVCRRIEKDEVKYRNCDWYDIDDLVELQAQRKRDAASRELQARVRHRTRRDHFINEATLQTDAAREEGETKASRTRNMQEGKLAEKQKGREENRWDFQNESSSTSPRRDKATRDAGPMTSKAKRIALLQKQQTQRREHEQ